MQVRQGFIIEHRGNYRPAFEAVGDAGFDHVELNMGARFSRDAIDPPSVRTTAAENDLDVVVHLPFTVDIGSPHPEARAGACGELEACIDVAAELEARRAVLHARSFGRPFHWDDELVVDAEPTPGGRLAVRGAAKATVAKVLPCLHDTALISIWRVYYAVPVSSFSSPKLDANKMTTTRTTQIYDKIKMGLEGEIGKTLSLRIVNGKKIRYGIVLINKNTRIIAKTLPNASPTWLFKSLTGIFPVSTKYIRDRMNKVARQIKKKIDGVMASISLIGPRLNRFERN